MPGPGRSPRRFRPRGQRLRRGIIFLSTNRQNHRARSGGLKGFYGIESIFLLLVLMALARIRSLEQLRYQAPGEWGKLLGLDRIPEVRTLRAKLKLLCQDLGQAMRWNAILAKEWIARQNATELYFYCDGHVRVYHGDQTALPRHYVARERLCLRATTDYWINAMDGQPFLYVNKEVDPGLIATL